MQSINCGAITIRIQPDMYAFLLTACMNCMHNIYNAAFEMRLDEHLLEVVWAELRLPWGRVLTRCFSQDLSAPSSIILCTIRLLPFSMALILSDADFFLSILKQTNKQTNKKTKNQNNTSIQPTLVLANRGHLTEHLECKLVSTERAEIKSKAEP